jgi:hypothetical protein
MKKPEAEWPCKRSFGMAPVEEIRRDMMEVACSMALAMKKVHNAKESSPRPQGEV